jgi:hypothetical protein
MLAGKASIADESVDVSRDEGAAVLNAAMAFVEVGEDVEAARRDRL